MNQLIASNGEISQEMIKHLLDMAKKVTFQLNTLLKAIKLIGKDKDLSIRVNLKKEKYKKNSF